MKILSNKEYETLKENAFNATLYYHQAQVEKKAKEKVIKEKVAMLDDLMKLEEKCRNYKKQIEEYEADSILQNETIKELNEQIRILKGQVTRAKNKIKNAKSTPTKKGE